MLVGADVFFLVVGVTERNLRRVLREVQYLEDIKDDVDYVAEFLLDLVGTHEKVRVVLRETSHAGKSVKFAALLVTVNGAKFCNPQRQVLVTPWFQAVNLAVVRAVHRFQKEFFVLARGVDGLERILAVFCIVSGSYVQILVADMRGDYLLITVFALNLCEELCQGLPYQCTFGQPQRKSLPYPRGECKEFHILANLAVVAFLGFFEEHEVLVEHFLLGEGNAIHAGEHLVVFVAAPICTGNARYLHSLDIACARQVRTTAEVGVSALSVFCDCAVFEFGDEFTLVVVALGLKIFERVSLCHFLADVGVVLTGDFHHLLLNRREVLVGDNLSSGQLHIVIETIFERGTDAKLGAGVQLFQRLSHKVSRRMTEGMLALVVVPLVEHQRTILVDRPCGIPRSAIECSRQYFLCKAVAQSLCYVQRSASAFKFLDGVVRKSYFDHLLVNVLKNRAQI